MTRHRRRIGSVMLLLGVILLAGCVNQAPDTFPNIVGETLAQARLDINTWCDKTKVSPAPEAVPVGIDETAVFVKSFRYTAPIQVHEAMVDSKDCPGGGVPVVTLNLAAKVPDLKALTFSQAQATLAARGISFKALTEGPDGPLTPVLDQDIKVGDEVALGDIPSGQAVTVTPGIAVPDLANLPAGEVCGLLKQRELTCELPRNYTDKQASNPITTQDPAAKTVVALGSTVVVDYVPSAVVDVAVPNVLNLTNDEACANLQSAGLTCSLIAGPQPGIVVQQAPAAGELVQSKSAVGLTTRSLLKPVPNVVGLGEAEACRVLADANYTCAPVKVATGNQQGTVVAQDPPPGRPITEARVPRVIISVTDILVTVPDIRGEQRDRACEDLRGDQLACGYSSDAKNGKVTAQNPAAGTKVLPGTLVSLELPENSSPIPPLAWVAAAAVVLIAGEEVIRRARKRRLSPANVQVLLMPGLPSVRQDRFREW